MKTQRQCEVCGKTFECYPSRKGRYCSNRCAGIGRMRERQKAGVFVRPSKPRRGETIPCETCGALLYRNKSEAANGKRYCSPKCAAVAQTKEPIIKSCGWCGKELRLKPSQAAIAYCSKACEGEAKIRRPLVRIHNGRRARKDQDGYIYLWEPTHPNKSAHGWIAEHRLVAEAILGRYLMSDEHVHHINGVKDDNDPINLSVLSAAEHRAISAQDWLDKVRRDRAELDEYRRRFGPLTDWPPESGGN